MLSDACFDFLTEFGEAARKLAEQAHWHAAPDQTIQYGEEIDALRRACLKVAQEPTDAEASAHLLRLAASILRYHDTPPGASEQADRKQEMATLVRALRSDLSDEEADQVPVLVEALAQNSAAAEEAAGRLKGILARLSKPAYDLAIKVISDIGSATAKRFLGL
jgi:hypothetical protein